MQGSRLKLFAFVALIASFEITLATQFLNCDKTTCPDSPVLILFEHLNCTGVQLFLSVNSKWDECTAKSRGYELTRYTDSYMDSSTYASDTCGKGEEFPQVYTERYYFGSCFQPGGRRRSASTMHDIKRTMTAISSSSFSFSSGMYLRNANKTFDFPQDPVIMLGVPDYAGEEAPCSSLEDCRSKSDFILANLNQTCSIDDSTTFTAEVNVTANKCYQDDGDYIFKRCAGQHTIEKLHSRNADCSRPFMSTIAGGACKTDYTSTTFCVERTTPDSPISPSSDASSFQMSTLSLVVIMVSGLLYALGFS